MDKKQEILNLIEELNLASRAYYQEAREIMSNYEYDAKYDRLLELEAQTGIVYGNSPSQRVGYEVVSKLPKEAHPKPMLSLSKTKSVDELAAFLGDQKALLSWKLDGLTVVLTYSGGTLTKAVTRGNGEVGEIITANAKAFDNIPLNIPFSGELVLRGEAVIGYSDFDRINDEIDDDGLRYKNPRNLCSGSVRQLNSAVTANRHVKFYAFCLVSAQNVNFHNSRAEQFEFLNEQGFDTVEYLMTDKNSIYDDVLSFKNRISSNDIPSDGLVLTYEDISYGESLGTTAKYPRDSIAFKWADEISETTLRSIEWSPSRTGLINPVAAFDPVELEGTTVSRASVHNVSILKQLKLDIGDTITVYKANMIIPQIDKNISAQTENKPIAKIPDTCPACGMRTEIKNEEGVETLYCTNSKCPVKKVKSFELLVSRDALNVDGLSEATLEKFLSIGIIKSYSDIYHLKEHKDEILELDGFGEKMFNNLIASINDSRNTDAVRVLYCLGIPGIGLATSKLICAAFDHDIDKIRNASIDEFMAIDQMGEVLSTGIYSFFRDEEKMAELDMLLRELNVIKPQNLSDGTLLGKSFVITGTLNGYENRKALQTLIEQEGGKVSSSVSAKTDFLINNDSMSTSSKNKKAKELGVTIITEEEFNDLLNGKGINAEQ